MQFTHLKVKISVQNQSLYRCYHSQSGLLLIEYHRQGGLNNRHLFPIILDAGKSKVEPEDLISGEGPLPVLPIAVCLLLVSFMAESREETSSLMSPLIKALIPL